MKYKDQFTPWKESENVLDEWMMIALLAQGKCQEFVHNYLNIETSINGMRWSAKTYVLAKKRFDP